MSKNVVSFHISLFGKILSKLKAVIVCGNRLQVPPGRCIKTRLSA